MSSYRPNEKRGRLKLSKNLARMYRESKCRQCTVKITPMDFAKILGKFTRVKIQYEICDSPESNSEDEGIEANNARLKKNENGMVLINRNAYNKHPVKGSPSKKLKTYSRQPNNILKENNRQKKTPIIKDKNSNYNVNKSLGYNANYPKRYGITFNYPKATSNESQNVISLSELLPLINDSVLPSDEWIIDHFPKDMEPKDDKVYDRIAAELEDLMYNDKVLIKTKQAPNETKLEDFPSIMDILNDTESVEKKLNESNDVEAMLMGESDASKPITIVQMDVDVKKDDISITERASSPSILDDTIHKGVMIHLPETDNSTPDIKIDINPSESIKEENLPSKTTENFQNLTHVVFKQMEDGKCSRLVMCPQNLVYSIELGGHTVELKGAPKFVSSLEDLKVLLEIVNETQMSSFYVVQ